MSENVVNKIAVSGSAVGESATLMDEIAMSQCSNNESAVREIAVSECTMSEIAVSACSEYDRSVVSSLASGLEMCGFRAVAPTAGGCGCSVVVLLR